MIAEPGRAVGVSIVHDADVAGADESSATLQKRRAAAVREFFPLAVKIRAGDFFRAAHPHFIGAVRSLQHCPQLTKR